MGADDAVGIDPIACPACEGEVSASESVCPECGSSLPTGRESVRWAWVWAAFWIVASVLGFFGVFSCINHDPPNCDDLVTRNWGIMLGAQILLLVTAWRLTRRQRDGWRWKLYVVLALMPVVLAVFAKSVTFIVEY